MCDDRSVVGGAVEALMEQGGAALRVGDAAAAASAFEQAIAHRPSREALEGLARARYLALDHLQAIELWERAYAEHRDSDDQLSAIRVARTLAYMYGAVVGDWAVSGGWMSRAQTLLAGAEDSVEAGWVSLHLGMFEPRRDVKEERFQDALTMARRYGDGDLEFVTLAYLGASLVHADRTEEGMLLLDEALAAAAGREVDDFGVLEEIFCQLFSACEHAHDVKRADQWIRVGEAIAERRNLPSVSAFCRTHYGAVLTAAGRWPEAEATLTEAVRLWGLGHRSGLRGGALLRLADLRIRQGRFEEAVLLLEGLEGDSDAARLLASIHMARGELAVARDLLERALELTDPRAASAGPTWALVVDVHLAAGDLGAAEAAAEELVTIAARHASDYLRATAALARGRVCLAADRGDPLVCLREALAGFERAQMPMELARTRLELASALRHDRPEVALAEARAALEGFERLQAARDVDAAGAMLRSLGARVATTRSGGLLTKREAEVLDLIGHGLSNPEIAERLYISRKTVEHHVGNVLAKLGLRSRSEAAVHAARRKPGSD